MWVIGGAAALLFVGLFNHTNISPPESKHILPSLQQAPKEEKLIRSLCNDLKKYILWTYKMTSMPSQVTMIANAAYHDVVVGGLGWWKFQEDLAAWNQRKAERAEFLANRQKEIAAAAASDKETLNTLIL